MYNYMLYIILFPIILTNIYPTGLPRPKRPLQHNNVGTLHTRANSRSIDC